MGDVDVSLASLATRQSGVVSRQQLLDLGLSSACIGRRLAARRLLPLYRGVYAVGHASLDWRGRAVAAVLAVGERGVISHRSAAAAWGFLPAPDGVIEMTVTGSGLRRRPGLVVHRASALDAPDVRRVRGVPVTSPARTLVDLARAGGEDLDRAVAEAQVLRLVTRRDLAGAIERAADRRGMRALRRALESGAGGPTRSELERTMLRLLAGAGLPRPRVNARVGRFMVDFLWADERVVAETDGWAAHANRRAFERDRARDAELHAAGYVVLRFTWRQIDESPLLVAARVAQVLAVRG